MRARGVFQTTCVLVLLAGTAPLDGQTVRADSGEPKPVRRWHVAATWGKPSAQGSWRSAVKAIVPAGQTCGGGGFFPVACQQFPHYSGHSGSTFALVLGYAWRPQLEVRGVIIGSQVLGGVLDATMTETTASVTTIGVMAEWTPGVLHVGIGPAIHFVTLSQGRTTGSRLGLIYEAGLRFPRRGRVFVDLGARWQVVGERDIEIAGAAARGSFSYTTMYVGGGVRM